MSEQRPVERTPGTPAGRASGGIPEQLDRVFHEIRTLRNDVDMLAEIVRRHDSSFDRPKNASRPVGKRCAARCAKSAPNCARCIGNSSAPRRACGLWKIKKTGRPRDLLLGLA